MCFDRVKILRPLPKTGLGFLLLGIVFLGGAFLLRGYWQSREKVLSFSKKPKMDRQYTEDQYPTRISIPSLKINLEVFPARVVGDKWEISKTGVSYLLGSGAPGKSGNTVIYGHNKRNLLGSILRVKNGAEIEIENNKGEKYIYLVLETKTVPPEQVEVLNPTEDPRLTIYTCTGFLDSKRFVVISKLKP